MATNQVIFCGDSITNNAEGSALTYWSVNLPTIQAHKACTAVGGASIDSAGQAATIDALFNAALDIHILCVLFGANDLQGTDETVFVPNLKSFCLARRAAGFKIIVSTVLPGSPAVDSTRRHNANAAIRADTSFYDVLNDIGNTSTTMGADAANADATLYIDGLHPTTLGNNTLEPYFQAAISTLLTSVTNRFSSVFAGSVR